MRATVEAPCVIFESVGTHSDRRKIGPEQLIPTYVDHVLANKCQVAGVGDVEGGETRRAFDDAAVVMHDPAGLAQGCDEHLAVGRKRKTAGVQAIQRHALYFPRLAGLGVEVEDDDTVLSANGWVVRTVRYRMRAVDDVGVSPGAVERDGAAELRAP